MFYARRPLRSALLSIACLVMTCGLRLSADDGTAAGWKAGAASVVVTPETSMWMAGYAARNRPSEGTAQDLYVKALAVEDADGARLVIVTCDLIGIPRALRDALEVRVKAEYSLPPEGLLLNASHTHCGPELRASKASIYGLGADRVAQAREYLQELEDKIVGVIGAALDGLEPASLEYCHARCGFAMNRRLPEDGSFRNSPNPEGPVDHSVPVLVVRDADNQVRTLLFGYACHNTTLGFYQFCGDYAGYAQEDLEADHPGVTAMFMAGCGGDQNPYPRGELEQAQQHGRALANSVTAALQTPQHPLRGRMRTDLEHVTLEFAPPAGREELERQAASSNQYERRHAELLLQELDETGTIRTEYDYLVQAVRLGDQLLLVALAGETVVDYSLRLKQELDAPFVWIAGYSNDVFGYVPTLRVLREGGYEGGGAFRYTAFPGPFAESVEERIVETVHRAADAVSAD